MDQRLPYGFFPNLSLTHQFSSHLRQGLGHRLMTLGVNCSILSKGAGLLEPAGGVQRCNGVGRPAAVIAVAGQHACCQRSWESSLVLQDTKGHPRAAPVDAVVGQKEPVRRQPLPGEGLRVGVPGVWVGDVEDGPAGRAWGFCCTGISSGLQKAVLRTRCVHDTACVCWKGGFG